MDLLVMAVALPFLPALLLAAHFGHPARLLFVGFAFVLPIPFVLAVWDPDGPCDSTQAPCDFIVPNFTPGEWFAIGTIGALLLFLGWAAGVGLGGLARKKRNTV